MIHYIESTLIVYSPLFSVSLYSASNWNVVVCSSVELTISSIMFSLIIWILDMPIICITSNIVFTLYNVIRLLIDFYLCEILSFSVSMYYITISICVCIRNSLETSTSILLFKLIVHSQTITACASTYSKMCWMHSVIRVFYYNYYQLLNYSSQG